MRAVSRAPWAARDGNWKLVNSALLAYLRGDSPAILSMNGKKNGN